MFADSNVCCGVLGSYRGTALCKHSPAVGPVTCEPVTSQSVQGCFPDANIASASSRVFQMRQPHALSGDRRGHKASARLLCGRYADLCVALSCMFSVTRAAHCAVLPCGLPVEQCPGGLLWPVGNQQVSSYRDYSCLLPFLQRHVLPLTRHALTFHLYARRCGVVRTYASGLCGFPPQLVVFTYFQTAPHAMQLVGVSAA